MCLFVCLFGSQSRGHPEGLLNESWGQIFNERPIWPSALIQESGAGGFARAAVGKNRAAAQREGGNGVLERQQHSWKIG